MERPVDVPVRIVRAAVAHPPLRVRQDEAARYVGVLASDERRVAALARQTAIESRAIVLPPEELAALGTIAARNALYHRYAPALALAAASGAIADGVPPDALVTSSCTGYSVPGWGVELMEALGLPCTTSRLPITEAGCAGGVVGLMAAANYVRSRPVSAALTVAAEVCSLAFHAGGDDGNVTAALIFGDGAGAALIAPGQGPGLHIEDALSMLVPGSRDALGFALTDRGFYPLLTRELSALIAPAMARAAGLLLERNNIAVRDIGAWLIHPGGARILRAAEGALSLPEGSTRWSWDSMREFGNTSSAAIFDVLRRYLGDAPAPGGRAVIAAFGPGVSIELMLVRAKC
ncbi:MAG: hypothetical protein HYX53_03980 [Chloroflexi bacterium]|nr:hypothetical protein [Chloroflexota bacterium]